MKVIDMFFDNTISSESSHGSTMWRDLKNLFNSDNYQVVEDLHGGYRPRILVYENKKTGVRVNYIFYSETFNTNISVDVLDEYGNSEDREKERYLIEEAVKNSGD